MQAALPRVTAAALTCFAIGCYGGDGGGTGSAGATESPYAWAFDLWADPWTSIADCYVYERDPAGRPTSVVEDWSCDGVVDALSEAWGYDDAGRVEWHYLADSGFSSLGVCTSFRYDGTGRVNWTGTDWQCDLVLESCTNIYVSEDYEEFETAAWDRPGPDPRPTVRRCEGWSLHALDHGCDGDVDTCDFHRCGDETSPDQWYHDPECTGAFESCGQTTWGQSAGLPLYTADCTLGCESWTYFEGLPTQKVVDGDCDGEIDRLVQGDDWFVHHDDCVYFGYDSKGRLVREEWDPDCDDPPPNPPPGTSGIPEECSTYVYAKDGVSYARWRDIGCSGEWDSCSLFQYDGDGRLAVVREALYGCDLPDAPNAADGL
jgi:hypothetical protein